MQFEMSFNYSHLDPQLHGLENVIMQNYIFFFTKNHRGEIYYYVNNSDNKIVYASVLTLSRIFD